MFFATTTPSLLNRHALRPAARSFDRFLEQAMQPDRGRTGSVEQDETSYTLRLDVPGVAREQLSIGIEGSVVRIQSKDDAPRKYRAAYELPTDLDAAASQARLENGVLTLKLAKLVPASKVAELAID